MVTPTSLAPGTVEGQTGHFAWATVVSTAVNDLTREAQGVISLSGPGIDTTGATDSTTALKALVTAGLAAGATKFIGIPGATYKVAVTDNTALFTFTGTESVLVDMSGCTLDNSATSYTADTFTSMFLLNGARNTTVLLGEYLGFTLPTPTSHLGYRGATLVRAINGSTGITVNAYATNLRYGVQSGEYGDSSKGQCSGFDITIRGSMIGYPVALYYANNIRHDIDVNGCHRAAYIAGCDSVRGVVRFKDQYIADTVYQITDCLTSGSDATAQVAPPANPTTSRGSSNIDVTVIDKGSTVFQNSSTLAGITLSRVDACQFRNIKVSVYSVGATDTVSPKMGAFRILSNGVPAIWSRYTYNWEPSVILDNVTVSGIVDHSAVTVAGNSASEFYVYARDDTGGAAHSATVRGFNVDGLTILPSSAASPRESYFIAPNLTYPAKFRAFNTPGLALLVFTNANVPTHLDGCTITALDTTSLTTGSKVVLGPGTTATAHVCFTLPSNLSTEGGTVGGAGVSVMQKETTLTLTGASVTWTSAIPINGQVLAVQGRVGTAITGASGYTVGVSGTANRYADTNTLTAGSTFRANANGVEASPRTYTANTDLIVTAKTSNFTAGTLRLVINYLDFSAPTVA